MADRRAARAIVPAVLAMGVLTIWVETCVNGTQGADWSFSPLQAVLIAGRTLWFYAGKLIWPHPLAFFYPRWTIDAHQWWQYLYPAATLATLVTLWFRETKSAAGRWRRC